MTQRPTLGILIALCVGAAGSGPALAEFDDDFTGKTLRVDYYHSGTATEERFALERARVEGPWPGSRTQLLDDTNLGKYLVEVADATSHRLLYSRGFSSIFGEWETTGPARRGWGTLAEAVRLPEPRRPFQLRIRKRAEDQSFVEVWTTTLDPTSRFVDRPAPPTGDVTVLLDNGAPAVKVDLVVLGDGYTAGQRQKFLDDARRLGMALFEEEPYRSRKSDFNVRAVFAASPTAGVSRPRSGEFHESALGARYNIFDSERYVLSLEDRRWRDVAAAAPYDAVLMLVNQRKYGGGGIYNLYSTAAADSAEAQYLVVHEFGHHFASLADEYYTSPVSYEESTGPRAEPWEPNVTALLDPEKLKWGDLVADGTPLPTPWAKQEFETYSRASQARRAELRAGGAAEEELEKLFRDERVRTTEILAGGEHGGKVGAFEGASYEATGLYRPSPDCLMFTRDDVGFCAVCRRGIERIIDLYAR